MERHVGIYEMRSKLGEIVRSVADGASVVVDVRGKPVARLVPYRDDDAVDAAAWLISRVSSAPKWGVSAVELIHEGRKD